MVDAGDDMSSMVFQWSTQTMRELTRTGIQRGLYGSRRGMFGSPVPPSQAARDMVMVTDRYDQSYFTGRLQEALGPEAADHAAADIGEYLNSYVRAMEARFADYNSKAPEGRRVTIERYENGKSGDDLRFGIKITAPDRLKNDIAQAHESIIDALAVDAAERDFTVQGIDPFELDEMAIQESLTSSPFEFRADGASITVPNMSAPQLEHALDRAATRTLGEDAVAMTVPEESLESLLGLYPAWKVRSTAPEPEGPEAGVATGRTSAGPRQAQAWVGPDEEAARARRRASGRRRGDGTAEPDGQARAKGVGDVNGTESRLGSHEILVATDRTNDKQRLCTIYTSSRNADALSRDLRALGSNPQKLRKLSHKRLAPDHRGPQISANRAAYTASRMAQRAAERAERETRSR